MAIALAAGMPIAAQGQERGGIQGRVTDAAGRVLPFVEVIVERAGITVARVVTGADGAWRLADLEPGVYAVTIHGSGYRTFHGRVPVEPGRAARLTVVLQLAAFTLDTLVVAVRPTSIATTHTELGTRLTAGEISFLPATIDARQLIALTPGARPDQIWGGASDQANAYTLDGTTVSHIGLGGTLFLPSPSWIEAFEVRGLGAGAEVGGAQGGVVDVVTLGGGREPEGRLRMSAESHHLNGSNLIVGEVGQELATRWELDGQLRGPLVRERLHFALFGQAIRQREQVVNHLPSRTGEFVDEAPSFQDHRWLAKLDWRPDGRSRLEVNALGRHQRGDRAGQTGYEAAEATGRIRRWVVIGGVTWQRHWSAQSALTVRLGGYVAGDRLDPYAGPSVPGIEQLTPVDPFRYQNAPLRTRAEPSRLGVTMTWARRSRLAGLEHDLRLGGEYAWGYWNFERRRNGGMTWRPLRVLGFDPADPTTWVFLDAVPTAWGGEVAIDSDVREGAFFVQDYLQILSWLRLNPGLRFAWWSGALTPSAGPRFVAVRHEALEPRVGVVVLLEPLGGLVAKAHWGRYHQPMFAGLFDRAAGAGAFVDEETWSYLGPAPASPTHTFTLAERDSLAAAGLFRLEESVRLDQAGRVERYRQPKVDQILLALERMIGIRWKAGLVYVYRRNRDLVALVDRNLTANYTVVEGVMVRDRFGRVQYFDGQPLVLDMAISNEDILRVQELRRQGVLLDQDALYAPPGLSAADLAALRYEPDYVLTTVPEATRRFDQLQIRMDGRYGTWWAGAYATLTTLVGNINVVTGPDDYTTGGPGPWVRLNEQANFFGALSNQSRFEARVYVGGQLPVGVRGGVVVSYATGDRVTPTMLISPLMSEYAVEVRDGADPATADTLPLHPLLFQGTSGHRIFIRPRGTYRYEGRASLDLHLERGVMRGGTAVVLALDAFNVLGDRSVIGTQTVVNTVAGFNQSDYGRVRARVSPRTLRLGIEVRFGGGSPVPGVSASPP